MRRAQLWQRARAGRNPRRASWLAAACLVLTSLLAVAACGGSESSEPQVPSEADVVTEPASPPAPADAEAESTSRDAEDILVEFTECIRAEGFPVPDPDFSLGAAETQQRIEAAGIDLEDPDFEAAVQTCEPVLAGIVQSIPTQDLVAYADATVEYAGCMRDNGIDLPDPDFTQGFSNIFGDTTVDATDPEFTAADAICQRAFENLPDLFGGS